MTVHPSDIARAREVRRQIAIQEDVVTERRAKLKYAKDNLRQMENDRQELNNIIAESVLSGDEERRVVKGAELTGLSTVDAIKVLRDPACKLDLMTAKHVVEAYRERYERDVSESVLDTTGVATH